MKNIVSENIKALIGTEGLNYYNCVVQIRDSQDDWHYQIQPEKEFRANESIFKQNKIYWTEILFRCHIAVLVSIFRSTRWIDAITESISAKNYYSFASNLRGLIESIADSFYTLRNIPLTIAKDFSAIHNAIKTDSIVLITHDELEKVLIHFTHAAKKPYGEKKSKEREHFYAKQTQEYLKSIKNGNDRILDLYSFLCQISHPSFYSNSTVLFHQNDKMIVCGDSFELELNLINTIIEEMSEFIQCAYRVHCISAFEILNLLNLFNIKEISTNFGLSEDIKKLKTWNEIEDYIKKSETRYNIALNTGDYD